MKWTIIDTNQVPMVKQLISPLLCYCDIQEGLNIEECLPSTPTSSQVNILQGHDKVLPPSTLKISTKELNMYPKKIH